MGCSQHFGIVGNGQVAVAIEQGDNTAIQAIFPTNDAVFDCCWSEVHPEHVISGGGDGGIRIWDISTAASSPRPILAYLQHQQEVSCVVYNLVSKSCLYSSSWDGCVCVFDPASAIGTAVASISAHAGPVYEVAVSGSDNSTVISVGGDGMLCAWDTRSQQCTAKVLAHPCEVLCCDWNKYDAFSIATGAVDRSIRIWDLRMLAKAPVQLIGHGYGVKRLRWSAHAANHLLSCSYDTSVRLWELSSVAQERSCWRHHTEFATGIDWDLFAPGRVVSCGWDNKCVSWDIGL